MSKPKRTKAAALPVNTLHTVKGESWAITAPATRDHTVAGLLAHCKVDLSEWEVKESSVSMHEMGSIPRTTGSKANGWERKSTTPVITPLYRVWVSLKRKTAVIAVRAEIDDLRQAFKKEARAAASGVTRRRAAASGGKRSGLMLEVAIPDLHMGKLAWAKETGYQNYDITIAQKVHDQAIEKIMDRTSGLKFDKIVYVVGNDLLNADNAQNTTTGGTPQHCDVRFQKTFRTTRMMVSAAIQRLRSRGPVLVPVVPGNHDTLSSWCLGHSLECLVEGYGWKDVYIDNGPTKRKYVEWGKVMLMLTHGDKGKHAGYPLLMATEQREMFGRTAFHEVHLGHLHGLLTREINGVRVRVLSALTATDAWHSEMGYVGNVRAAEGIIWDRQEGNVGNVIYTAPDTDSRILR